MPTRPTRIDDCGASALSTRKMRVAGAAPSGAGSFGARPRSWPPLRERRLQLAAQRLLGRVAGDQQRRVVGPVVLVVEGAQIGGGQLLDRRLDAGHRPAVGVLLPEQQAGEGQVGHGRRAVLAARDRRQQVVAHPLELLGLEGRVHDDVGEQRQRRVQVLASVDRLTFDASQVLPVDSVRAQRRDLLGDGERVARLRPLVEHVRGQVGQPGAIERVGGAAGLDHQVEVDERQIVEFDQHHLEAVLQLEALRVAAA